MNAHQHWYGRRGMLEYARALLEQRPGRHRLLSVVTYRGRIRSIAFNSYVKTHPWQAELARSVGEHEKIYLHAEVSSLLKAKQADSIHVFRLSTGGQWVSAKPCKICQMAISLKQIKNIYYT